MYRCVLGLAADLVIRDAERNTLSIIDLVEDISVASFPVFLSRLTTIWVLEKDPQDADQPEQSPVLVFTIDGQEINRFDAPMNFDGRRRTRILVGFGGYVVPRPGLLKIALMHGGNELGAYRIDVTGPAQPVVQAVAAG